MTALAISYTPRTRIRLGGFLGKRYGKVHHMVLDRGDPGEAMKALDVNFPGFAKDLITAQGRGLRFAVFKNGKNIGESELDLGGTRDLVLMPVIEGSKRGGILQTVLGVVLFAVGAVLTYASGGTATPLTSGMMMMGASLAIGGVIQMLSPQARGLSQSGSPANMPSYAFGSAKNTTASGNPVPICIGNRRWGGAIISASIYAEDKA